MTNTLLLPSLAELDQRYQHLVSLAQDLPPDGSLPITVCGRVAGWATAAAKDCLQEIAGVQVTDEAIHIAWCDQPSPQLDDFLAHIAQRLHEAGLVKAWRDERLDVIAEGEKLAAIERGAMRPLGLLTQAVHLNAWSQDGRLWVAKRAANKPTDPNMWDTLVGGLATAHEDLDTSLLRESEEEAGLLPEHLKAREPMRMLLRMYRRLPEGYQVENVLVNDCVLPDGVIPKNQDGEVSEIRLLTIAEWWDMAQAGLFTIEAEMVLIDSVRLRLMQA
ncbi:MULTISPECIES: NUDIX hydrolase [Paenalcaligenes]|uniref:NUDIX domain-containing protein n=1 Tax=Paenalcaligenes hermetiae TaxID=1157987 RepID=A0ABP9M497_9BURK|nr:NUDIX domain-containing protein [Paenalcaligenes sp.]